MKPLNLYIWTPPYSRYINISHYLYYHYLCGSRFDKNVYVLAAELQNILPAVSKMLRKSESIVLPTVEHLKRLFSNSCCDKNVKELFESLQPQLRLVKILFDEVKLGETLKYSGGRVAAYLCAELCSWYRISCNKYFGYCSCMPLWRSKVYITCLPSFSKLNSEYINEMLIEALETVGFAGGIVISCVCDN